LSKHGIGSQQKALQTLAIQLVCMVIMWVGQKFRGEAERQHYKNWVLSAGISRWVPSPPFLLSFVYYVS